MIRKILLVSALFVLSIKCSYSQNYSSVDSLALLNIDNSCDTKNNLNWNTETNPVKWAGVLWNSSSPKRVVTLNIKNKALTGTLNVSNLDSLEYFYCDTNKLDTLIAENLSLLNVLSCNFNILKYLNVSGCSVMYTLNCRNNLLTNLDIANHSSLNNLSCGYNNLITLNVSGLTLLLNLSCGHNKLLSLDLSPSNLLEFLDCSYNQLTSLSLANLVDITDVFCDSNQIKNLNLSGLISLKQLSCQNNQLDSLDLSDVEKIDIITVRHNHLSKIIFSSTQYGLEFGYVSYNKFPFSFLKNLKKGMNNSLEYSPQDTIFEPYTTFKDTLIDYSSEAIINDSITNFRFYKNNIEIESNNTGKFKTTGTGVYYSKWKNGYLPGLELMTANITVSIPDGINLVKEDIIKFYPNPAKDKLYTNFNSPNISGAIFDLQGKRVAEIMTGKSQIDISNLLKGVYLVKIFTSNNIIVCKLIKE